MSSPPVTGRTTTLQRRHVRVRGEVQGVGFRPFVYRLATRHGLSGWVRNDAAGVELEIQGEPAALAGFLAALREPPDLARITGIEECALRPHPAGRGFSIQASGGGVVSAGVTPDAAVCEDCLRELFDPTDRRYRYPFINCTNCGPRYTITGALPYDRPLTSMAAFSMCQSCEAEYHDPGDRRFHAQPDACERCGPQLRLLAADGTPLPTDDVIAESLARLRRGEILAVKGLGGFHLVCDAHQSAVVARLRARKHREAKPFAVMVVGLASLDGIIDYHTGEAALLTSPARPIVLLDMPPALAGCLPGVAPGLHRLGVMLPYTPLHYLLFHEAAGRPAGCDWLAEAQSLWLVMTSANPGGEPLVTDNAEAVERLGGIADALLVHDRDILVRCDDSVVRWSGQAPVFIRRARGYTPRGLALNLPDVPGLALGAHLKNTVCVVRHREAVLSQHIGDLDNRATRLALEETVVHLLRVLAVTPRWVARDWHPDYHASRVAETLARERDIPCIVVQHHHAHIAAVLAEHGVPIDTPALGVALDGVGLGENHQPWGGELLWVQGAHWQRLGHLGELPLPGGDLAAREPWRLGAAALARLGREDQIEARFPGPAAAVVRQLLARRVNTPLTSSAGRWFDAAASLLGVRQCCAFEGQAAMELEALAARHGPVVPGDYGLSDGILDLLPLLAGLLDEADPARGAARFHATLVAGISHWVATAARDTGISRVALGGGCFLNDILGSGLRRSLADAGLTVLTASRVPPNDGGLGLGQAQVALAHYLGGGANNVSGDSGGSGGTVGQRSGPGGSGRRAQDRVPGTGGERGGG